MIDFARYHSADGIPIYFQRLSVRSVSVYWLVFVGSADDERVGNHGLYHWFEHLPSRGTRKYPDGYRDTEARLVRHGGSADAETHYDHTAYYADVPRRVWTAALDILTDMIAQPLLRTEDIEAERQIIRQEYEEWHSSTYGEALCRLPSILYPGHPLGHDQLGSPETLASMQPSLLREAHRAGYARSRCVLFVSGDLEPSAVISAVDDATTHLSAAPLSERRAPASYGRLPDWEGGKWTVRKTEHDDIAVFLLFPVPAALATPDHLVFWTVLKYWLTAGNLGSPLNRAVREQAGLAYSPEFSASISCDGGYWGLTAQSNCDDPHQIVDCLWSVLRSAELRSPEWGRYVTDSIRGEFDMQVPSPGDFTEQGAERLTSYGHVWSNDELLRRLLDVRSEDVVCYLDQLSPALARTIVFEGQMP